MKIAIKFTNDSGEDFQLGANIENWYWHLISFDV
jgi:hypothetical protein